MSHGQKPMISAQPNRQDSRRKPNGKKQREGLTATYSLGVKPPQAPHSRCLDSIMYMRSQSSQVSIPLIKVEVRTAYTIWPETSLNGYKTGSALTTMLICRNTIRQALPWGGTRAFEAVHGKALASCSEPPQEAGRLPINGLQRSAFDAHVHRSRTPRNRHPHTTLNA